MALPERPTSMVLRMNRSMPASVLIPVLGYPDVRAAVEWLCSAFGFVERLRIGEHRSQLSYGEGSVVVVGQPQDPDETASEGGAVLRASGSGHALMVRVVDVDAHCERARRAGARILGPPMDYAYGERQYTALDPVGRPWTFSQTIADVDPVEWGGEPYP
jgi:uncharacterized glyoxalase superfamily protein PhnB